MLPTINCSQFMHLVLPHCSACPDPIALHMIRRSAIRFAEISKSWRHTGSVSLAANNQTIVAPTHTEIHTIEEATLDGQRLEPVPFLDSEPTQLTGLSPQGQPYLISQVEPGVVQVHPFRTGTLRYAVTLKPMSDRLLATFIGEPLRDARDTLPAYMLSQHAETIAEGAIAMILKLPNQPFTDPAKAMQCEAKFMAMADSAHADARMGQQRAPRRNTTNWT